MGKPGTGSGTNGMASGLMLAGAVGMLALPSAVLAFSAGFERSSDDAKVPNALEKMDARQESPQLALSIPMRSLAKGKLYPFTPAESPNRPDRSITVAVRIDPHTARTMSVGGGKRMNADAVGDSLHIASTGFSLGVARGYRTFSQNLVPPTEGRKAEIPDLSQFSFAPSTEKAEDSRFSPRIVMDEKKALGRSPRTFSGDNEDQVDVGGSLRVTRNLDVTAGVRYSQERERLRPLTDGRLDNQAVYVGTQFRF